MVSNRLPVTVSKGNDGTPLLTKSSGGLVSISSGLAALGLDVLWIGWPGTITPDDEETRASVRSELATIGCRPVFLDAQVAERFYEGYSNSVLWPLLHTLAGAESPVAAPGQSNPELWTAYCEATKSFAAEVQSAYSGPSDIVWVQDYQLFLLCGELRMRLGPAATISFFLHVPFPQVEVLRTLPEHVDIIQSMLSADLVGFHIEEYATGFLSSVQRVTGHPTLLGRVLLPPTDTDPGHLVHVGAFPMGIDFEKWFTASARPWRKDMAEVVTGVRSRFPAGDKGKIVFALSRLDFTKGIPHALHAFRALLVRQPSLVGHVLLVLVVIPSREKCEKYGVLRREIEELVGQINGTYSTPAWSPVLYLYRSLSQAETVALYADADVGLVVPLRDGMNLVAKEFVACHAKSPGALVLSSMAGAAKELLGAIVVNPLSVEDVAAGLETALMRMTDDEMILRNTAMAKHLDSRNIGQWARTFVSRLGEVKQAQEAHAVRPLTRGGLCSIADAFRASKRRLIVLDYDGTLVDFTTDPHAARPPAAVLSLLRDLAAVPDTRVLVLSGRDRGTLGSWLSHLPIEVAAEHGAWVLTSLNENGSTARQWKASPLQDGVAHATWKKSVLTMLRDAAATLPGAAVEEKTASVAFHFRKSRELAAKAASPSAVDDAVRSLRASLAQLTSGMPCRVTDAKEALEVRSLAVNKGALLRSAVSGTKTDFVLVVGDDETDEDAFAEAMTSSRLASKGATPTVVTIRVGHVLSRARWNVSDVQAVLDMLRTLISTNEP